EQSQEQSEETQPQAPISQKQALDIARARFPGNVISINEARRRDGVMRYRIRLDNNGNIITVFVDSRTGAVSRE
ncbi:MAG: PepSY domain-containing protein, partial [Pseudomonadales bacterium]|nr:PepSY domain-containing protein [Pseudomonadales bacterium]